MNDNYYIRDNHNIHPITVSALCSSTSTCALASSSSIRAILSVCSAFRAYWMLSSRSGYGCLLSWKLDGSIRRGIKMGTSYVGENGGKHL